jgi:hypothetical protein
MERETRFVIFGLGTGLCFALAVGFSGVFQSASAPIVAAIVWSLTAVVLLGCWKIPALNAWWHDVDLRWLVLLHVTRFVGFYFLVLCRRDELPCSFAQPAGIGDICVAGTALLLIGMRGHPTVRHMPKARRLYRSLLLIWNVAGLLDILFVVFSALRVGLSNWQSMAPLRELPLSLLPMFLVPLIIASHVLIFVRLFLRRRIESASP